MRTDDLRALIDSMAADIADLDHELEVPDSGGVLVACRAAALRRAFYNLLENAGAHGVRATVRIPRDNSGLRVAIEDEGAGIPEAALERMFEPFVRLDESRNLDSGDARLDPNAAQSIIRGHGVNNLVWFVGVS